MCEACQIPRFNWSSNSVPLGTTSMIRSPPGPPRIQHQRDETTTCSIWLAWSTTMVNIGRYKQYPGSISRGKHRQVSNIQGWKSYGGVCICKLYRTSLVLPICGQPYEGGQLDRFHCITFLSSIVHLHESGLDVTCTVHTVSGNVRVGTIIYVCLSVCPSAGRILKRTSCYLVATLNSYPFILYSV